MSSRQERCRAERDAARPVRAGAAGARGAAAAAAGAANVNVNPGGDWTTQTENPAVFEALGAWNLEQKANAGDRKRSSAGAAIF